MKGLINFSAAVLVLSAAVSAEGKSMKEAISDKVKWQAQGKSVTPLFSENFKVIGIGLKKGQMLEKHQTPTPAFLFVHQGRVEFHMDGETLVLGAGDMFKIPPQRQHEVIAVEDARLLLAK